MADPLSLAVGDRVTHPEWPEGTIRKVTGFAPFKRHVLRKKGGGHLKNDPVVRIVHIDKAVLDGDIMEAAWMEAGLVKVDS